jgi:hypothetical protein
VANGTEAPALPLCFSFFSSLMIEDSKTANTREELFKLTAFARCAG